MKSTFAVIVLAALAPSLLVIERITAAPPAEASETSCDKSGCAKKPCCGDKSCGEEKAFCDGESCCEESCCGDKSCCKQGAADQTKTAYIVLKGGAKGDYVREVAVTPESDVNSALCKNAWPHPIDFASARIWITRLGSDYKELSLPVAWDATKDQPTCKTNHALLSGDRLFVAAPTPPLPPLPLAEIAAAAHPKQCASAKCSQRALTNATADAPPISACSAPAKTADCHPCQSKSPANVVYSAIPAPVPSPFSIGIDSAGIVPPIGAVPALAANAPPLLPPSPPAPICQVSASVIAPNPIGMPAPQIPLPQPPADECEKAAQVLFSIDVIEDKSGSLSEFGELASDMPFLTADSEIILATLRILGKHDLVRQVSSPRLVTTVGHSARLQIRATPPIPANQKVEETSDHDLQIELSTRELGGGLEIKFKLQDSSGCHTRSVATSLLVAHGQTVVMKTGGERCCETDCSSKPCEGEHPVYVVLTPQIVK